MIKIRNVDYDIVGMTTVASVSSETGWLYVDAVPYVDVTERAFGANSPDGQKVNKEMNSFQEKFDLSDLTQHIHDGRGGNNTLKYKGQLVAIVQKGYIWITPEVREALGNCDVVTIHHNDKVWALRPYRKGEAGSYIFDKAQKNVVRAISFIKSANLPVKYLYRGVPQDGMVVFSKTPSDKV
jgi:hypothetical protein